MLKVMTDFLGFVLRRPAAILGLALLLLQATAIAFAPWLVTHSPIEANPAA